MKKILSAILVLVVLFLVLTYWSVSVGPSEIIISQVAEPKGVSGEYTAGQILEVIASNRYEANAIKRFMQGRNYRAAWAAAVPAQVFLLDSFNIQEEGGGNQTKSLKIRDKKGTLYSLRSINKDPDPLVPEVAKKLELENIVIDGISAQHPYGAILAAELANAAGVLHTRPKVVFVPKHSAMGKYAEDYGDRLFLLEHETEGRVNWTAHENVQEIVETDQLQEMKVDLGEKLEIDIRSLVRARLFDLLIGDWDRHAKQWGWVLQKKGEKLLAVPLPGDRDNAFFNIDGMIPSILTNKMLQPLVRPFEKDIDYIPGYVYPFDLYFLKDVPQEIFVEEAKWLQQQLTDNKIEQALEEWPKNLVQLDGAEIATKLKHRRDELQKYALKFRKVIEEKEFLTKPLKGSEDLDLSANLLRCFACN